MNAFGKLIATGTVIAGLGMPAAAQQADQGSTRVRVNGRIWTADAASPWAEAVAIRDGRILAVGSEAEVLAAAGPEAERQDLGGEFVVPGFIDAHTHFNRAGSLLLGANLLDVADASSFRRRIAEADGRLPNGGFRKPSGITARRRQLVVTAVTINCWAKYQKIRNNPVSHRRIRSDLPDISASATLGRNDAKL